MSGRIVLLLVLATGVIFGGIGVFLSIMVRKKEKRMMKLFALGFIISCVVVTGNSVLFSSFAERDASDELNGIIGEECYTIGSIGLLLSINARFKPLTSYIPVQDGSMRNDTKNRDLLLRFKPKFCIVLDRLELTEADVILFASCNMTFMFMKEYEMMPNLLGIPRVVVYLYNITDI
jgi:ABC-type transport system involved in multi-copper enzyme maturation permease subunit